VSSKLLIK